MAERKTSQEDRAPTSVDVSRSPRVQSAWQALDTVADPEIPTVSILELGMIADVREEDDVVVVDMTPTFVGCPALALIQTEIIAALAGAEIRSAKVNVVYNPPWTTDRITQVGRRRLKEFGLAPPGSRCEGGVPKIEQTPCPFCDSTKTELESIFGPTLCRSIHYCRACLQSFEHFKPV